MRTPSTPLPRAMQAKGVALGMWLFTVSARARQRMRIGPRIRAVDHIAIPCDDLASAEAFYVGLLGARVMLRADEAFLRRLGRNDDLAAAAHLSLVLGGATRVDLFAERGSAPPAGLCHPHFAFRVAPSELLPFRARLNAHGVPTFGPTRLGPPGQASLYFNDPSGNHLELVATGYIDELPVGPPDMATLGYRWTISP